MRFELRKSIVHGGAVCFYIPETIEYDGLVLNGNIPYPNVPLAMDVSFFHVTNDYPQIVRVPYGTFPIFDVNERCDFEVNDSEELVNYLKKRVPSMCGASLVHYFYNLAVKSQGGNFFEFLLTNPEIYSSGFFDDEIYSCLKKKIPSGFNDWAVLFSDDVDKSSLRLSISSSSVREWTSLLSREFVRHDIIQRYLVYALKPYIYDDDGSLFYDPKSRKFSDTVPSI